MGGSRGVDPILKTPVRRRELLALGAAVVSEPVGAAPTRAAAPPAGPGARLAAAARRQVGVTRGYDGRYRRLAYPGGDVPRATGVCADVVVRAARDAWGLDLQQLVHEDMTRAFAAYPQRWGLKAPDANIDHRRVPNLETYWIRAGAQVWRAAGGLAGGFPGRMAPGDILTFRGVWAGGPHVAIVTQGGDWPSVVQNHGWGAYEAPLWMNLFDHPWGHFRWLPA